MNPVYKFELTIGEDTQQAFPLWRDDLAKDFELESGQQFFRAKLSGKLTFESVDYARIVAADFDTQFLLEIFISYDAGATWASYWHGTFWKTDCEFDGDNETVIVTPTVNDEYNDVLAGLEKEYNLIELLPEIVSVKIDKRPMIQVYVPGQSVIGCFLSGMWWEQECEPVEADETIIIGGQSLNKLTDYLYFYLNKTERVIDVSGSMTPELPDVFAGVIADENGYELTNGAYKFKYQYIQQSGGSAVYWQIIRVSDDSVLWQYGITNQTPPDLPNTVTLTPVSGSGATGNVELYLHDISVYARMICDVDEINGVPTAVIPDDDLVENNRNYKRVVSYNFPETIAFSSLLTETPTQWGLYQPGKYYQQPYILGGGELFPIARNGWGRISVWFRFASFDHIVEQAGRAQFTLKDAYELSSVISVLLAQVAPGLTHEATTDYSEFLYGTNPLTGITQTLLITPKSNLIAAGYDQPAQKAPITLKSVLDMLRDCFRCYWFVDAQGRFRIEHIRYFMLGGTYTGTPVVGTDLTAQKVTRNGKPWAFARDQYQFEKPNMAARYQFGWMDDVTQLFEGYPIDIISKYVTPGNIEEIQVSQFTSDVDYILLNPSVISKDGFVLLGAVLDSGDYVLPYINFVLNDTDHYLQNAYVAFIFLQQYYLYDLPATQYEINGVQGTALGIKKLKIQTLKFPMLNDPDLVKLIKTNIGNGMIQKLSVNLSSRTANTTLKYDTE